MDRTQNGPSGRRVAALWAVALIGVFGRLLILPTGDSSLFPVYHQAGLNWRDGADLYPETIQPSGYPLFRYSPAVAAAFAPLSRLPFLLGDATWRLINTVALLGGIAWMLRSVVPTPATRGQAVAVFALMLVPALGHLSNGQCNALVIGLICAGFAAVSQRRWTLAAACVAASSAFKLYPVAAGMLLTAIHPRRFGVRFLIAAAACLALPYALHDFGYVTRQYELWFRYLTGEDRSVWGMDGTNLDLQLLFRVWLTPINLPTYRIIEVVSGAAFAAICLAAVKAGRPERRVLTLALGLSVVWMTAFGPATESPTYLLLAPPATWAVVAAWSNPSSGRLVRGLVLAGYGLPLSLQLAALHRGLFSTYRTLGPQPAAALLFLAGLLLAEWRWQPAATARTAVPAEAPSRAA